MAQCYSEPILKVPIANDGERGMLGIAVTKNKDDIPLSFYIIPNLVEEKLVMMYPKVYNH